VRAVASDHPTASDPATCLPGGDQSGCRYKAQYNGYDAMGQRSIQSNPTEINPSWYPAGDDAAGWVWSQQAYDWKGRLTVFKHPDDTDQNPDRQQLSYGGCGCAGGEVLTLTDEVGRRQRISKDVLGRVAKTEVLNLDAPTYSTYSTTTTSYNVRDQVTSQMVQQGTSGTSQTTTFDYDGHGRLVKRWLPIYLGTPQSATPYTSYEYFADNTLKKATRVVVMFTLNNLT